MRDLPPLLERLEWVGDEARLSARPNARWGVPALAVAVMVVALGLGSPGDAGRVIAVLGACGGAFALSLVLIGLRARYALTFDFASRVVRVEDVRGFGRPLRSERAFADVARVLTKHTPDGALRLGLVWAGDHEPSIVAQVRGPATTDLESRLRNAGL